MAYLQSYWFRVLFMSLLCVTARAITINNNLTGELCEHTVAHEGPRRWQYTDSVWGLPFVPLIPHVARAVVLGGLRSLRGTYLRTSLPSTVHAELVRRGYWSARAVTVVVWYTLSHSLWSLDLDRF